MNYGKPKHYWPQELQNGHPSIMDIYTAGNVTTKTFPYFSLIQPLDVHKIRSKLYVKLIIYVNTCGTKFSIVRYIFLFLLEPDNKFIVQMQF